MAVFEADQLAEWSSGSWGERSPERPISGFSHDSRKVEEGDLFIAIKTEERDGHDYLNHANEKGAAGALVSEDRLDASLPQLKVEDTLKALRDCATAYRKTWDAEVIGITGSCGKTTAKDLLSVLLGDEPEVHSTEANLNNTIGVPLTLLRADSRRCRFAVIEAGINQTGEMEQMADCIKPSLAVFTSIGPSHLEGLGDEETIAVEKGQLAKTGSTRKAFLGDACQPYRDSLFEGLGVSVNLSKDLKEEWDYQVQFDDGGSDLSVVMSDQVENFRYHGQGSGLACNVTLAIAVACELGISNDLIRRRLLQWKPGNMRGEWVEIGPTRIFLDCYNANPLSMRDALESFIVMSVGDRPRLFILGSMEELGGAAPLLHRRLGQELPKRSQDSVLLVGEHGKSIYQGMKDSGNDLSDTILVDSIQDFADSDFQFEGDIFVKGSRKYRLEKILQYVESWSSAKEGKC